MTTIHTPTKAELLDAIRVAGRDALERLRALPPGEFVRVRYDNGWTGHDILAHIAGIESIYPLYIKLAELGAPSESALPEGIRWLSLEEAPGVPTVIAPGGIDAFNARIVAEREHTPVVQLLAEFEDRRAATVAAVEAADGALLSIPIRTLAGATGSLSAVLYRIAVEHIEEHVRDICEDPR
jgi:hypothetical protein